MKIVTIATFENAIEARLAQNVLSDAGIRAMVADENTMGASWMLGNAIGWVKLQVLDTDAERALELLNEKLGDVESDPDSAVTEDAPDLDEEALDDEMPLIDGEPNEPPASTESRDDLARRVFFVCWFGLLLPPLAFYALYLFQIAVFGEGELSPRGRIFLIASSLMMTLALAWAFALIRAFAA